MIYSVGFTQRQIHKFVRSFLRFSIVAVISFLAVMLVANPPAQSFIQLQTEMDKVKSVSSHLITITQGMAEASILPVGISSSVKILRHVVLNNV